MRLGRLPHDPARLAAAPAHRFGATPPPSVLDRRGVGLVPGDYGNTYQPDCTAATLANAARGVAALNGFDLAVDAPLVPAFYGHCVGDPPNPIATDGAVLLDVLAYQERHGFDVGPQALVGRHGTVALDRVALATSLFRLGVGYWGVSLRERDLELRPRWDVQDGRDDGAVVGGHCVPGWDYTGLGDDDTVRVGTWGRWQPATWAWLRARLEEAHALVWRQLARADGTYWSGVRADGLVNEL